MNRFERIIKRTFDFTLALISLVVFSPLIALIALMIKREEPDGDVLYCQERIGYKGKPFMLYKFRSMRMDAERDNSPQLFTDGDSRLTRVGAFIRAHHLDEFPQLSSRGRCPLSDHAPSGNSSSTRLCSTIQIMCDYMPYVRGFSPMRRCIMDIPIRWRRCWSACA